MEVAVEAPFIVCSFSPPRLGKIPFGILTGFFSNFQLSNIFKIKLYRNLVSFLAFEETDGCTDRKKTEQRTCPHYL